MKNVNALVNAHNRWRNSCLNLLPSENVLSPKVSKILSSDLAGRYSFKINSTVHGSYVENAYRGTKYFEEVLEYGSKIGKEIFQSKYIELRALGGHIAAMVMLLSLTGKKDLIFTIHADQGGYDGYMPEYMPDMFGLNVKFVPFNIAKRNIDYEKLDEELSRYRPRLLILGTSYFLFSYDLKRIREMCDKIDCKIAYDGSHVMGLIAGKAFQKDVLDYSDVLLGSTHKSMFGPQGGLLITNDSQIHENIEKNLVWRVMDNYHLNRVAALVQALEETRRFGKEYAEQVVKNARRLGIALEQIGFPVLYAQKYTETHQLLYDQKSIKNKYDMDLDTFSKKLERSNIIIDSVGRIGTAEITRLGVNSENLEKLADLFISAIQKNVKKNVVEFRKKLKIRYC